MSALGPGHDEVQDSPIREDAAKARILLVDNDESSRISIAAALSNGYEVMAVSSVSEAREILDSQNVDASVIDVHLEDDARIEDLSGLEFAESFNQPMTTIIVTAEATGEITRRVADAALRSQPAYVGFWGKEEDTATLASEIEKGLQGPKAPRSESGSAEGLVAEIDKLMALHLERILRELSPARIEAVVRSSVTEEIKSIIFGPILDNYRGYVCAKLLCQGQDVSRTNRVVRCGETCELEVWFQSEEPLEVVTDSVDILDGQDSPLVRFDVRIDSNTVRLSAASHSFDAQPNESTDRHMFRFWAPEDLGKHEIWVEVYQKNRLIQVLSLPIEVVEPDGSSAIPRADTVGAPATGEVSRAHRMQRQKKTNLPGKAE